jgi:tetratricopeptide (TPR) repeat protein
LADGYWRAQNGEKAEGVYQRVLNETEPVPAIAYERLGMLNIQTDVAEALRYLVLARNANPENLETLYFLGEIYYANQDMDAAAEAWESYLASPGGAGDTEVQGRLKLAQTFRPLLAAVEKNPTEANLLALADSYWTHQERGQAVDLYFQLLTEKNPHNATALSRVGQQLFFGGRNEDAIAVLGRAREIAPNDLQTLLFFRERPLYFRAIPQGYRGLAELRESSRWAGASRTRSLASSPTRGSASVRVRRRPPRRRRVQIRTPR